MFYLRKKSNDATSPHFTTTVTKVKILLSFITMQHNTYTMKHYTPLTLYCEESTHETNRFLNSQLYELYVSILLLYQRVYLDNQKKNINLDKYVTLIEFYNRQQLSESMIKRSNCVLPDLLSLSVTSIQLNYNTI